MTIREVGDGAIAPVPMMANNTAVMLNPTPHSEHCRACKIRVHELLTALYPDACHRDHAFPWPSTPEAYRGTRTGAVLQRIFEALRDHRGYGDFIRTAQMPPCDYHLNNIASPGFILEFDERQHFTRPRAIALGLYPRDLRMGFPVGEWLRLCAVLDERDPEPPDRDERRAWYDTLRDLLPTVHGLRPTVRLYERALRWCEMRPDAPADVARFKSFLEGGAIV